MTNKDTVLPVATDLSSPNRQCGHCTACCEGWLSAVIKGNKMYPGRPCFFLASDKCTNYEERPSTCKAYECAWKVEQSIFPEWMRPDLVGVIITKIIVPSRVDLIHYEVAESSGKLDVKTLNWLIQMSFERDVNILYEREGKHHAVGSPTFKTAMTGR